MPGSFKTKLKGGDRLGLAPEIRLGLCLAASVASLLTSDLYAALLLLAASGLYVLLQVKLKTIAIVYIFFSLMISVALLFVWILTFVFAAMKNVSLLSVVLPFIRLGITINAILPLALYASMSGLLGTMNRLNLPGIIKLPMLITIRFIPSFINDLKQIREAVRLRFKGRGKLFWFRHPLLWWRVFFMPLVVRLIRSADELAIATELKGMSTETDFGSERLHLASVDKTVILASLFILVGVSTLQVLNVAG